VKASCLCVETEGVRDGGDGGREGGVELLCTNQP